MPERKDEAFCRRSFKRWLTANYPDLAQKWCYEPNGQRAPDYSLRLGDCAYAVEVTRIAMPDSSAAYSIHALCEECQQEAETGGMLHGAYALIYDPPTPNFRFQRRRMKLKALAYIAASAAQETAPESTLLQNDTRRILRIRGSSGDTINDFGCPCT
jgi:hypothetical protein